MIRRASLLVALFIVAASCGKEKVAEPVKVKAVSGVRLERVVPVSVVEEESFSGFVIPNQDVFISPKVVGYLVEVKVKVGDRVKKGEVLAVIDSSDIRPDVERARAGLREIEEALKEVDRALKEVEARKRAALANYELAKKTYERFKRLLEAEAVSKQRFDEVEAQFKAAKANLEAVRAKEAEVKQKKNVLLAKRGEVLASLKKAKAFLSYTELKSPVDGIVLQKLVDKGNLVSPQTPVFKVGSYPLKVRAFIDNSYAGSVKVGSKVKVIVKGREYEGKVVEIDRSSDPVSHKFGIKVMVEGLKEPPGTYAVVKIPKKKVTVLTVPKSAIYRVGAVEYVFVVKDGIAHLRMVKTGESVGDKVEILSGLLPGESIAVTNVDKLADGARVEG